MNGERPEQPRGISSSRRLAGPRGTVALAQLGHILLPNGRYDDSN